MTEAVELPLLDARELALALLPHVDKSGFTPVLGFIGFGVGEGNFAYATDRYTVGRFDLTNIMDKPGEPFLLPASALSAVKALGLGTLPGSSLTEYVVRYEITPKEGSVKMHRVVAQLIWAPNAETRDVHWMRTWFLYGYENHNFPRVALLFQGFKRGELTRTVLGGSQVSKFSSYAKGRHMRVTLPDGENKPSLIEIGFRFKGLIQPFVPSADTTYGTDLAVENAKHEEATSGTS